ncbi:2063_t:CDS:2, partial [Acaulospora colombiana]
TQRLCTRLVLSQRPSGTRYGCEQRSARTSTHSSTRPPLSTTQALGIGSAIAIALAQAGAHVILVLRPPSTSNSYTSADLQSLPPPPSPSETVSTLQSLQLPYSIVYADISDKEHVRTVVPRALEILKRDQQKVDRIGIVVHAAGIQRRNKITEFRDDDWEE